MGESAQLGNRSQHRILHRWLNAHDGLAPVGRLSVLCREHAGETCWRLLCLWLNCSYPYFSVQTAVQSAFSEPVSRSSQKKRPVTRDGPFGCPTPDAWDIRVERSGQGSSISQRAPPANLYVGGKSRLACAGGPPGTRVVTRRQGLVQPAVS